MARQSPSHGSGICRLGGDGRPEKGKDERRRLVRGDATDLDASGIRCEPGSVWHERLCDADVAGKAFVAGRAGFRRLRIVSALCAVVHRVVRTRGSDHLRFAMRHCHGQRSRGSQPLQGQAQQQREGDNGSQDIGHGYIMPPAIR